MNVSVLIPVVLLALSLGCSKSPEKSSLPTNQFVSLEELNRQSENGGPAEVTLGDQSGSFRVFLSESFQRRVSTKEIKPLHLLSEKTKSKLHRYSRVLDDEDDVNTPTDHQGGEPAQESLLVSFPLDLLGQEFVFGGVVTGVSDTESEVLGRLKLASIDGLHVKTLVHEEEEQYYLVLLGCIRDCTADAEGEPITFFPIIGVTEDEKSAVLDLAPIGKELDLALLMGARGEEDLELKEKVSATIGADFGEGTLLFDIKSTLESANADIKYEVDVTARWFLKRLDFKDEQFTSREATDGVGFFMTERAKTPLVQYHDIGTPSAPKPAKYYVKNVPKKWQPAFKAAFDSWNETFLQEVGSPIFEYEFLAANDARNKTLVPGDPRYNILEWDLVNNAPYGGLGPSMANQFTGKIYSSNVLVQGPTIIELYTKWFAAQTEATHLRNRGREALAERVLAKTKSLLERLFGAEKVQVVMKFGKKLMFKVFPEIAKLSDPLISDNLQFEQIPEGVDFDSYMNGYFLELVAHELGHNIGLRHNFRGNLAATDSTAEGEVSSSIMEYMGRPYRHLNRIAKYDIMAIKYGYLGVLPEDTTLFCTDEDVAVVENPESSPECSRDDATADPYSFFEQRLKVAVDLLVAKGSELASEWTVKDMERELGAALTGLGFYASQAEKTSHKWTHFHAHDDRPDEVSDIKAFVLRSLQAQLCQDFTSVIQTKESPEARAKTAADLAELSEFAKEKLLPLKVFSEAQITCSESL